MTTPLFTVLLELTKCASAEAVAQAQEIYDALRIARRGAKVGFMLTPVVHDKEMKDLKKKFHKFKVEAKKNPDLLKELKK